MLNDIVGMINAGVEFTFTPDEVVDYKPFKKRRAVKKTIDLGLIAEDVEAIFYGNLPLGSLDEAKEIYEAITGYSDSSFEDRAPEGWKFVGKGGTRACYRSPDGVLYKVCHRYYEDRHNNNDIESENYSFIKKSGKVPKGWRLPRHEAYRFVARHKRWSYDANDEIEVDASITVLAVELVKGKTYYELANNLDPAGYRNLSSEVNNAFWAVGLDDAYMGNAMQCSNGFKWYVDVAESFLDPKHKNGYVPT
jgi:uncharacterized protein YbdZ (MbtH family)